MWRNMYMISWHTLARSGRPRSRQDVNEGCVASTPVNAASKRCAVHILSLSSCFCDVFRFIPCADSLPASLPDFCVPASLIHAPSPSTPQDRFRHPSLLPSFQPNRALIRNQLPLWHTLILQPPLSSFSHHGLRYRRQHGTRT